MIHCCSVLAEPPQNSQNISRLPFLPLWKNHSPLTPQGIACPKFPRIEANLEGAYFTNTILQAKNLKGAILTEALMPVDVLQKLCEREDVILGTKNVGGTMFSQWESRMMFFCLTPGNDMLFFPERVASQLNAGISWNICIYGCALHVPGPPPVVGNFWVYASRRLFSP